MGPTLYVVAALAGNAWRESHVNPALQQENGTAFGLFQWDGGRKDNLFAYMSSRGLPNTDPYGQIDFLLYENDWLGTYAGISSLTEFLESKSTDIPELTTAFCTCWERPGVPALQERIDFANKAYTFVNDNIETNITTWETEPEYYLTEEQALRNTVLMYKYLGGYVPPEPPTPPTPTKKRKGMPVWLMLGRPL